jgi:hypothetical protein
LYCCSPEEIQATRELEDFLAQLEFFCYLESRKTISSEDLDASLGFWLSFLKENRFIALRAYLQENSFEYLVKRLGGEIKLNRILVYGTLKSGKTHDQLSALYEWSPIFFSKITGSDLSNLSNGLFETVVRFDLEVVSCGC